MRSPPWEWYLLCCRTVVPFIILKNSWCPVYFAYLVTETKASVPLQTKALAMAETRHKTHTALNTEEEKKRNHPAQHNCRMNSPPSKWRIGSLLLVPVPTKIVTIPFASSLGFILAPICSQNLISCPCCSLNEISLLAKLGRCSISCETPARI